MRHTNSNSARRANNIDYFEIIPGNEMQVIEGMRTSPRYDNARAVLVHYKDGSPADGFSWRSALSRRSDRSFMVQVARDVVQPTIDAYRMSKYACEWCGHTTFSNLDVHHSIGATICELVNSWIEMESLFHGEPKTDRGGAQAKFINPAAATRWRTFHDTECKLELLCVECHYKAHHPTTTAIPDTFRNR
jgi:hypothetical protein